MRAYQLQLLNCNHYHVYTWTNKKQPINQK